MSKIYIGTSGWVYKDWQGLFYPKDLPQNKWLEYYSQKFKTVEVNSTFYHQMKPSTFAGWSKKVPKDFVFSIKANRFITHVKRLLDCGWPLERLLEQVKGLGDNLGPVLFQLPPRMKVDEKRLEAFLNELRQPKAGPPLAEATNQELKVVFEFRDESWFQDSVFKILGKYNVALVINDSPHFPRPPSAIASGVSGQAKAEWITTDFIYIRFHGPSALYSSEYSNSQLKIWAAKIKRLKNSGISVFGYFNNDVSGFAVKNAKTLASMVGNLGNY